MSAPNGNGVAWKVVSVLLAVVGFFLMLMINRNEAEAEANKRQDARLAALEAWAQENSRNVNERLNRMEGQQDRIEIKLDRVLERAR